MSMCSSCFVLHYVLWYGALLYLVYCITVVVVYIGVREAHQRTTLPALISGFYPREFEDGDL